VLPGEIVNGLPQPPANPWQVAWYEAIGQLGVPGNVVLAAYRDFPLVGPATFAALGSLSSGDSIELLGKDRAIYGYEVTGVDTYPADELPVSKIFGRTKDERLTLMTVGGRLDGAGTEVVVVSAVRGLGAPAPRNLPTPADRPSASDCDLEGATLPDKLEYTRAETPLPPPPSAEGTEADAATVEAISAVVRFRVACANDANFPALISLFSNDYLALALSGPTPPFADVVILGRRAGRALKEEAWRGMPTVEDARVLVDGRVVAVLRPDPNDVLSVPFGPVVTTFVKAGGAWLIDGEAPQGIAG
jgi:hypothetical protein